MTYTLDDLGKELAKHDPGYGIGIDLPTYRHLFPPGEPDPVARKMAQEFASANNCTVHYEAYSGAVFFRKKKPNEVGV
jgi:hypothetical protein